MAPSRRASRVLIAALLAGAAHAEAPQFDRTEPIHLDARGTDVDYKNNKLAFHSVKITQGPYAIEADHATSTGLDFKASQWVFTGNVRITVPDGLLTSNEARIEFVSDSIANAQITGTPAAFEQKRDKRVARGHAMHIDYDFTAATVRLRDEAEVTDGEREITGQTLVYDMKQQRLRAGSAADDQNGPPVTLVIPAKKPDSKPNP